MSNALKMIAFPVGNPKLNNANERASKSPA